MAPNVTGGAVPPPTGILKEAATPKESSKENKDKDAIMKDKINNDKEAKEPSYLFRPVAESPDASPQRMRTRNKAAKEQTTNRSRPKRGTETPEPKTPSKISTSPLDKSASSISTSTPAKKKGKETPSKNRKRPQDKNDDCDEEKELGIFKKKRDRPEVCCIAIVVNYHKLFIFSEPLE